MPIANAVTRSKARPAADPQRPGRTEDALLESPAYIRSYHDRIIGFASRIRQTEDVGEIIHILDQALRETSSLSTQEEVQSARRRVEQAEQRILQLKAELEQVRMLLTEDPLTGTLNRRGLEEAFKREAARADRHDRPLTVALIDIDDFKRLNDSLGHQAGDAALAHMVTVIKRSLRPNDVIGRFGGEEFLLLLPDSGVDDSITAIKRLQRELAEKCLDVGERKLPLEFSAGVALRAAGESAESVIARADAALYAAKHAGKNRVVAGA
ncbi:MAG TPA: GGDEF domain-containing protein [Burkholderiales bacterium]|nr:GGDEF domain-containing protein [Burkholderiales bacterium]